LYLIAFYGIAKAGNLERGGSMTKTKQYTATEYRESPTILDGRKLVPPYQTKVVEFIELKNKEQRERAIKRAGYNTFLLESEDVYIDLLTDSGVSAMSDMQWAGMMRGDERYAGSKSFKRLAKAQRDVFGYNYMVPTHQGRGAEHIAAQIMIDKAKGGFIPNNGYFTTSRFHQEHAGAVSIDVGVDEAKDTQSEYLWKGNIDTYKLLQVIEEKGAENIPFVRIEACLNMFGGQPFSLSNLYVVSFLCRENKIFLLLDATRLSDNANFIKFNEPEYADWTQAEIIREICSLTDCCTMSSKKDHYVNIGGFFAMNDKTLFAKAKDIVVVYEGMPTYGGMAGYSMEALAVGIRESAREDIVSHYLAQSKFLGDELTKRGIPIVLPVGAHGVFLDAERFIPHVPHEQFPAQVLAAELYIEGGVRGMERGIVSGQHGKDPYTGLELVRLTLPRRVLGLEHLIYVVEVIEKLYKRRESIHGLKMTFEPPFLRFFQARFKRM
jgi:tyrosine phenol-lyase